MSNGFHRIVIIAAVLGSFLCSEAIGQSGRKAISFEVQVIPETERYAELLTVPGYAALALENNDFRPSLSSPLVITNREALQIRTGIIRYVGRKASVYSYEAGFNVQLGVGESGITFPVEIDATHAGRGLVVVRVFPPLATMMPDDVIERIQFKIRALASIQVQLKVLNYLDRLSKEEQTASRGFPGLLEAIVLEAYNRASTTKKWGLDTALPMIFARWPESLTNQVILIIILAIWLIGFPIFLLFARRRKKQNA